MFRIAMCDADANFLNELYHLTLKLSFQISPALNIKVDRFSDGSKLLESMQQGFRYDLIMLDWEMPSMNGEATGVAVRQVDQNTLIIFIASHPQYALKATQLTTFRYILKKYLQSQLPEALRSAYDRQIFNEKTLIVKTATHNEECLKVRDILYIQHCFGRTTIKTRYGYYKPINRTFLKDYKNILLECGFVQSYKGIMVNPREIKAVREMDMQIENDQKIGRASCRERV